METMLYFEFYKDPVLKLNPDGENITGFIIMALK